ncbi:MAG: DNA/RNA non-specific endonuclease [Bacteroidia bacterium]
MRKLIFWALLLLGPSAALAQDPELARLLAERDKLKKDMAAVEEKIEDRKLVNIQSDLRAKGLPTLKAGEEVVMHSCMALVYDEAHEQAKWVAHIVSPDIVEGRITRSNDFRIDPAIKTGSSEEADYFLKTAKPDGTFDYDGFGYDRGHLAPSADFRWSLKALSESYYYSNMSPQLPEFNRELWSDLEAKVRGYIFQHPGARLFVVTGPVLDANPSRIDRGVHKVAIPKAFFKVIADVENGRAIGFIVPQPSTETLLKTFAMPIDEVESLTGLDFFSSLPDDLEAKLESQKELKDWLPEAALSNIEPLFPPSLPKNHFNTVQAKLYMDKNQEVTICGTVVGARRSKKGNILMNLDKQYPDQIFTVFIKEEDIPNFSLDPEEVWTGKKIAVTGKVINLGGTAAMYISNEKDIAAFTGK